MELLKNQFIDVWFRDKWYKSLFCLDYDSSYLVCQEKDGVIRAFNHDQVREVICVEWQAMKTQAQTKEIEIEDIDVPATNSTMETGTINVPQNENMMNMVGGFIPERQTSTFRVGEMQQCASNDDDFSVAKNFGVVDPTANARR